MTMPLENPDYTPQHPPVDGAVPDVVAKWGAASQVRWFERFAGELKPHPPSYWDRFYTTTAAHKGGHCVSCMGDAEYGEPFLDGCCCLAVK